MENLSVESVATETYTEDTFNTNSEQGLQTDLENADEKTTDQITNESPTAASEDLENHHTSTDTVLSESDQPEHGKVSIENAQAADVDFKKVRTAPRGKASGEQVIECVFVSGPKTGERCYYELFDLSMGGLSFIVFDEEEVPKGTKLNITNLAGKEKVPPIKAESVSFAVLDESTGEFKVGVKFI